MSKRKNKSNSIVVEFFHTQGLPFLLAFVFLAIMFVLIRMKSVEQDYQYNQVVKRLQDVEQINKELKAKKAKFLSVKNLRNMAAKNKMKEPDQRQIIVIP